MNLDGHYRLGRFLFWFAQILGITTVALLILFIGGNLVGELIEKAIIIREDYKIFVIFLLEVLVLYSFVISWRRKRLGPILILFLSSLICVLWARESINIIWFHSPLLFSGLLLLFYSYYKEWILKRKA